MTGTGKHQDQENPGKFIGGLFFPVEDVDADGDAEDVKAPVKVAKGQAGTGDQGEDKGKL